MSTVPSDIVKILEKMHTPVTQYDYIVLNTPWGRRSSIILDDLAVIMMCNNALIRLKPGKYGNWLFSAFDMHFNPDTFNINECSVYRVLTNRIFETRDPTQLKTIIEYAMRDPWVRSIINELVKLGGVVNYVDVLNHEYIKLLATVRKITKYYVVLELQPPRVPMPLNATIVQLRILINGSEGHSALPRVRSLLYSLRTANPSIASYVSVDSYEDYNALVTLRLVADVPQFPYADAASDLASVLRELRKVMNELMNNGD